MSAAKVVLVREEAPVKQIEVTLTCLDAHRKDGTLKLVIAHATEPECYRVSCGIFAVKINYGELAAVRKGISDLLGVRKPKEVQCRYCNTHIRETDPFCYHCGSENSQECASKTFP